MNTNIIWTAEKKRLAAEHLLSLALTYEIIKAKKLYRRIYYKNDGHARLVGNAHNYSYWTL